MMYNIFCNKGKLVTTDIHMYIMVVKIRHSIHTHTHTHTHIIWYTSIHMHTNVKTKTSLSLAYSPHHPSPRASNTADRTPPPCSTNWIIDLRSTVICCIKSLLHDNLASAPREVVPMMKRLLNTVATATHLSRSTPVVCVHLCKQPIVLEKQGSGVVKSQPSSSCL